MFVPGIGSQLIERKTLILFSFPLLLLFSDAVQARIVVVPKNLTTGEISRAGKSKFAQQLELDLRQLSGIGSFEIDESGILRSGFDFVRESGSETFREFFLALTNDRKRIFVIEEMWASVEVHFAFADPGTVDAESGIVRYKIYVDASDFRSARSLSRTDVASAFSIGIVLFHEISHKVSYDDSKPIPVSGVRPDVDESGISGVIELTNRVRSELGFPLRRPGAHSGEPYRGPVSALWNTCSIDFTDSKGKQLILRWKL